MLRSITFMDDDIAFLKSLQNTNPVLQEFTEHLKAVVSNVMPEETVTLELSSTMIKQAVIAEKEWAEMESGIVNHIAIQFHHSL